ncbi:MAG: HAD family hydrolase [Candidatus Aenigmatarchaeota archaeon]
MIKLIIFDVGGTLVGSPDIFEYMAKIIDEKKVEFYYKYLKNRFSYYKKKNKFFSVREILEKISIDAKEKFKCRDISKMVYKIYEDVYIKNSFLLEHTMDLLNFLKEKNIKMVILSDADEEILIKQLKKLKIYDYFDEIFVSSKIQAYKPSFKLIDFLRKNLEFKPNTTVLVGDSINDKKTASRLNVKFINVNNISKLFFW